MWSGEFIEPWRWRHDKQARDLAARLLKHPVEAGEKGEIEMMQASRGWRFWLFVIITVALQLAIIEAVIVWLRS